MEAKPAPLNRSLERRFLAENMHHFADEVNLDSLQVGMHDIF